MRNPMAYPSASAGSERPIPLHPRYAPLTRAAIEDAAEHLEEVYGERHLGPAHRREHAYGMFHLAHELRLNLTAPPSSFVPGRSLQELSRAAVAAHAAARAFEPDPEVAASWETLARAAAASIGPKTRPEQGVMVVG